MLKTFRLGGIHPHDNKLSREAAIEAFDLPTVVTVPLSQHIGAPATALVQKGDTVKVGTLIGSATGFVSANVHSPVSGTVTGVDAVPDAGGVRRVAITIKVEGDRWEESIDRSTTLITACRLDAATIRDRIAAAGIVGMGGAAFPTQVKLSIPAGKNVEYLLINGAECEPYLTADHRVMLEQGKELLVGITILMKALAVEKACLCIEHNKPDAIDHLTMLASGYPQIEIVPVKTRYPQGGEKQLIDAALRRQVPSGCLPVDVGVVVQNVGTALAVYEAVQKNKPLIERVVTVTGKSLRHPANYRVRIGTPISALIAKSGGLPEDSGKVVGGGPMMGRAMANLDAPVVKGTSGVLVLREAESRRVAESPCIRCAKCVGACPMGLEPYQLNKMISSGMVAETEGEKITDCIECGCCAFTCPAHLPLLDRIRLGKAEVGKIARARTTK
ncbi:MAG: electron transport complex subunit RsxC [Rikenellaceae bacterium]|nr:electron transport complex subunit RsxC [Rikenellaceae bacterium]